MIRRPPRSTLSSSSAASDVYKRQGPGRFVLARGRVRRQGEDVPVVGDGPSACPDRHGRDVLVHGSAPVMAVGVDRSAVETALCGGGLGCPVVGCGGRLAPWGPGPTPTA